MIVWQAVPVDRPLIDDRALAGSSVVANNAMNRERGLSGPNSYARELGFDPVDRVRRRDGRPAGRALASALRRAGFRYDGRRRRVTRTGPADVSLPYAYLGADDRAGPNYTNQPAVHSYYERQATST